MNKTLLDISLAVGGTIQGDPKTPVTGAAGLDDAAAGDILFIEHARFAGKAAGTPAAAVIAPVGVEVPGKATLHAENPRVAFLHALRLFQPEERLPHGIAETARIGEGVSIGEGAAIGDHCSIGNNVVLGEGAILFPLVYVGDNVTIGPGTVIYPNVTIYRDVQIGARVRIHSSAVIGADGFGYLFVEGRHEKIPHIGTVVIEDDVELGACVCVDRAKTSETRVGRGTKIDNQVQIAHNCRLGEHCIMAGQSGLAGSASLGDYVVVGGQSGINAHAQVGSGAQVAGQSGVMSVVEPRTVVSGHPAQEHRRALRVLAATRQLPELLATVRTLQQRVEELEHALEAADKHP